MKGWRSTKWGELATLGYGKALRGYQGQQEGFPVYGTNGKIGHHDEVLCRHAGLIIGRKGAYRGVHYSAVPFWVIDTGFYLEPKMASLDLRWAYYQLRNFDINRLDSGSAIPSTSREAFYEIPVELPPPEVQKRVAGILSTYDDLIDNNNRRIEILERQAQLFYREWFVNFRFPSHDGNVKLADSDLGIMPERWCQAYPDHVDFLEGPGLRRWQYRESGLRFLNIRTIGNGDIDLSKAQFIDPAEAEMKYRHFLLAEHDHVVSSSGTIGRIVTVRREHLPLMLNTSVIRMRPKGDCVGRWQLKHFLKSEYFQTQIRSFASGVAQMNFGPSHLKQMKIVAPPTKVGEMYEAMVAPIEELALNLTQKNSTLRATRDLLLPKLLSGEINLEQVDTVVVAQGV